MKKVFLSFSMFVTFVATGVSQDTSPFWSQGGNSNSTSTSKLGSTNAVDLRFVTNNSEKMRVNVAGALGIGTTAPASSSILDISSTTKGLLVPRMTTAQRNLIASPVNGLLIYQTDNTPGFYYYTGSAWAAVAGAAAANAANTSLSNLSATTAVNQTLYPSVTSSWDLGSFTQGWRNVFATRSYYLAGNKVVDLTGFANTFLGNTGNVANTGTYNTFVGYSTGVANSSGYGNVAVGSSAMLSSQTGIENVSIGRSSLYNNISGSNNTAVGNFALSSNVYNTQNTAVGYQALTNTNAADGNTAIGYQAGGNNNNGYYNCFIGSQTGTNGTGYYNVITIGHGTIATAPSQVTIGNSATNSYRAYSNWSNISDGRYKKNIKENVPGLAFINKLKAVTYNLDTKGLDNFLNKSVTSKAASGSAERASLDKALTEKAAVVQTGFVAQDVEKAAKELGYEFSGVDAAKTDNDVYALRYAEFVVPLVKAVQELSAKNDEKDQKIASLEARLNNLEAMTKSPASSSTMLSNATLDQNMPNPFGSNTTIAYTLPQNYTKAQIMITDASGKLLKTLNVSGPGKGTVNVDASVLSAGGYYYSLYVDSNLISTKKMIKSGN